MPNKKHRATPADDARADDHVNDAGRNVPVSNTAQNEHASEVRARRSASSGTDTEKPADDFAQTRWKLDWSSQLFDIYSAEFDVWGPDMRAGFASSLERIMTTVVNVAGRLVDWRSMVGDDLFDEFQRSFELSVDGEVAGFIGSGAAELMFPGTGSVGAYLVSQTLGMRGAHATNRKVGDAKSLNRFIGGQVKDGIDAIVSASGEPASVTIDAAIAYGKVESMVQAAFPEAKNDLQRLLALDEVQKGTPGDTVREFAEQEAEQADSLIARFVAGKNAVNAALLQANTVAQRISTSAEDAFRQVQLEYVKHQGLGMAPNDIASPARGKPRFLHLEADAQLLRKAPLNGNLQIFLKRILVEGHDPGGMSKASTKSTAKRFDELDDAMKAAMLPQEIGALKASMPMRVEISLPKGGVLVIDEYEAGAQAFEVKGETEFVEYLAGSDDSTTTFLERLWNRIRNTTLEYWDSTALLFGLAQPAQFVRPTTVSEE